MKLPVSTKGHFLHLKDSYTNFTLAKINFMRKKAIAIIKNELWCMIVAYVDELAKDNAGVKFLAVGQDLFDRKVDVRWLKTKPFEP